jgi:RHS repeat-associated protein
MLLTRNANAYSNDANRNTLTGGGRTNTWDSENRLAQCVNGGNTCMYTYSADGLRRRSAVNGTITDFVLDDNGMLNRELKNGSSIATYLVGVRGSEYKRNDSTGAIVWYVYDGLGSVLEEVDQNGNVSAYRKYDAYGSVRSGQSGMSRQKFVGSLGHTSDDETGLIYMHARYMDPTVGRFASEDPSENGNNWYSYCNCNPVNLYDPDGCVSTRAAENLVAIGGGLAASAVIICFMLALGGSTGGVLGEAGVKALLITAVWCVAVGAAGNIPTSTCVGMATLDMVVALVTQCVLPVVASVSDLAKFCATGAAVGIAIVVEATIIAGYIASIGN